jgi:sRNA-binding carbon storage regulator CsrA
VASTALGAHILEIQLIPAKVRTGYSAPGDPRKEIPSLTLTRREGESLVIELADFVDPATPVGDLLADGGITVYVSNMRGRQVKLTIGAHPGLSIMRSELLGEDDEVA